jgi:cob(I)alamin adenosyltransferase
MKGYVQVYTGNGKGKTTAAIGLAVRAAGAGKKVFFAQFVKGCTYSEHEAIARSLPEITVRQYGLKCFIVEKATQEDIDAARQGLTEVSVVLSSGVFDLVILDEVCIAVHFNLFSSEELIRAIQSREKHTEVIVTGRYATSDLIEIADLVTEMKEIKHYYTHGLVGRRGIEF